MKNKILVVLFTLFTLISWSQVDYEYIVNETKVYAYHDGTALPNGGSDINIGTRAYNLELKIYHTWNGTEWQETVPITFIDAGYGFTSVDRSTYFTTIGAYAFDVSTFYNTDRGQVFGASGELAFATGLDNIASGYAATTFGYDNVGDANYAFVAGLSNQAGGGGSIIMGVALDATGGDAMAVFGQSNVRPSDQGGNDFALIVGNGTITNDASSRAIRNVPSDAFAVRKDGGVTAPSMTPAVILQEGNISLINKEWVNADVPATATSPGVAGQYAYDAGFVYVCIATNSWKRSAIVAW